MDNERLSSRQLKAILKKYLHGTATADEARQVERWYAAFSEAETEDKLKDPHYKSALQQEVMAGILHHTAPRSGMRLRIAAAAALLIAVCTGLYQYTFRASSPRQEAQVIAVPFGERKSITLPDGSQVYLNAGSTLTIEENYGKKERLIRLSGEGFFEVAADPEHPFIIHTGDISTVVLGTSFNIRSYPDQEEWHITMASGGVKVLRRQEVLSGNLTANRQLSYHHASGKVALSNTGASLPGEWRNNMLNFRNSSLKEIAGELERQYNVPVRVSGHDEGHYRISFHRQPLPEVLNILSGLTGTTYTEQNGAIIIHAKKGQANDETITQE
ncbi:FecR family protein [Chitinophaga sp. XS-30]|uniref:FecR family protein n=1 Tax=Chitinophaga sp. XS-30 TaxID=2604421 RepID=UPI0011DCD956|nr:FecR family protein [Chitinophaga sp. XS-30]QEH43544.1 DUF4974 domain-containing protein [Chitinophaga sp. XS-30]